MDDQTGTSTTAKVMLAVVGFLVVILSARAALGDVGVQLVLLVAMVALFALAWRQLTDRPLPRALLRRGHGEPAPAVEDVWRSERWIDEAVERGLRALEDWRLEQREA